MTCNLSWLFAGLILMSWLTEAAVACDNSGNADQIEIYPSAPELPSNLLRIYLYFPYPVRSRNILEHISLRDSEGRTIDGVFLSNRYDLWSPDRRRLTLLFDPGRVKTGLRAHETLGRALIPGEKYSLLINNTWNSDVECELGRDAVFEFLAIAPDYNPPKPSKWKITAPMARTLDPLIVDLGSPHDHISLAYRLRIKDAQGLTVSGSIRLDQDESVWRFTPTSPWPRTTHLLMIDGQLEDLAGNRPGRLFDRPSEDSPLTWTDELPWHPG